MARATRRSKKADTSILGRIKDVFTSSQGFPIFLTITALAIFFVLFRMKGVEIDYKVAEINRDIDQVSLVNKELRAKRAQKLSVGRLKAMAKKHRFNQPREDQLIVIP